MALEQLRYSLTEHREKIFMTTYENFKLLIHPASYEQNELLDKVLDDIELMPELKPTQDGVEIKFYEYDYNENVFYKSELLAFIFASINSDWNIIKGRIGLTRQAHFWLKNGNIIFDPSLSIITSENIYINSGFKQIKEIKNVDIKKYLEENNNLYKYYKKGLLKHLSKKNNPYFSLNFTNEISEEFSKNIESQYILDDKKIEEIKKNCMFDDFIELRQVLSQKRKSFLKSSNIAIHPSIDSSLLEIIEKNAKNINNLMRQEYGMSFDYYNDTLGNCYGLSILFNLYDGDFKLVQGGIPYQSNELGKAKEQLYQHSWLEKDNIVYDPALRIITPKDLYYIFVQKQDVYSKEETENILRRIGFNLTHFRDFMCREQIGNNQSVRYRSLINKIDSHEMREEGEKLIKVLNH